MIYENLVNRSAVPFQPHAGVFSLCKLVHLKKPCRAAPVPLEKYFRQAVPRRAWIEMRERREVIPMLNLKTKLTYLTCTPSASVSDTRRNHTVTNWSVQEGPIICV